jgi:hypothetical protein
MPMSPRLLRPRQVGGFDPRRIAGISCWYDGEKLTGASGDEISQWDDASGANLSGRNLVQSSQALRPTVTTVGGRKAAAFSGSQWMRQSALTSYGHRTSFAVFSRNGTNAAFGCVYGYRPDANTVSGFNNSDAGFLLVTNTANSSNLFYQKFSSGNPTYTARVRGQAVTLAGSPPNDVTLSPSPVANVNQLTCLTSMNTDTATGNKMLGVGIDANASTRTYGMTLCELILYAPALSVSEMQAIENYLIAKWSVP